MRDAGYQRGLNAKGNPILIDDKTGARFNETVRPGGAEASPLTEQIARAIRATEQAEQANRRSEQEWRERQLAADREDERKRFRDAEYRTLQTFGNRIRPDEYLTARVRVPTDTVASIVQHWGASTAIADEKPGKDGLTGINLRYSPRVNGKCSRITTFLEGIESKGGEVYEFADAKADRLKGAGSDRSTGPGYGFEQSPEISM